MTKYICKIEYSDPYINIEPGTIIVIDRVSVNSEGRVSVFPKYNHPIELNAFKFCFEELKDD